MGGKSSKFKDVDVPDFVPPRELEGLSQFMSKEELAGYLASVSDMAHTGVGRALPEIRINDQPPEAEMDPATLLALRRKMRDRLQKQLSRNDERAFTEHVHKQLELLDSLESKDDSSDWASMRSWLVWCLRTNLEDEEVGDDAKATLASLSLSNGKRGISRQRAVDQSNSYLTHQGSSQSSFDSGGPVSGQSSFDSCGATVDT